MRRILLPLAILPALAAAPVHAQVTVAAPGVEARQDMNFLHEVITWAQQAYDMAQQLAWMKTQYDQMVTTYEAIAHITDVQSALNALGGVSNTYLPPGNDLGPLLYGTAGLWGTGSQFAHANTLYDVGNSVASGTLYAEQMSRQIVVSANAQAVAEAAGRDAQRHLDGLSLLEGRLQAAKDDTEVNAIHGAIDLYRANLETQGQQMQGVIANLLAQNQVREQQKEQLALKSAQALFEATSPVTDTLQ